MRRHAELPPSPATSLRPRQIPHKHLGLREVAAPGDSGTRPVLRFAAEHPPTPHRSRVSPTACTSHTSESRPPWNVTSRPCTAGVGRLSRTGSSCAERAATRSAKRDTRGCPATPPSQPARRCPPEPTFWHGVGTGGDDRCMAEGLPAIESERPPQRVPSPKLLDRVRTAIRLRYYSRRTEQAYVAWIRRYIPDASSCRSRSSRL